MDLLIPTRNSLLFLPPSNGLLVTLLPSDITGSPLFAFYLPSVPSCFQRSYFLPIPAVAFLKSMVLDAMDINFYSLFFRPMFMHYGLSQHRLMA